MAIFRSFAIFSSLTIFIILAILYNLVIYISLAIIWGRQPTKRMLVFCLGWLVFCWFLVGFFDQPSPTTNIWGWFFGWLVHLVGFRSNFAGKPVLEPYLPKFCCFLYFIPENSRISTSQNSFVLELFQSLASSRVGWTPDSGPRTILFCLLSLYLNETS